MALIPLHLQPRFNFSYLVQKLDYSFTLQLQKYKRGKINEGKEVHSFWRNLFEEKLTYTMKLEKPVYYGEQATTALIRKIPPGNISRHVGVEDVVIFKDPETKDTQVGKLFAMGGDRMVPVDGQKEPFVLNKDECWIISMERSLQDAKDSRIYGPIPLSNIVGRFIYAFQDAKLHGRLSDQGLESMWKDLHVLSFELDVDEMAKVHQSEQKAATEE